MKWIIVSQHGKDNIDTLEQNTHWFMDGMFEVATELFVQLFTIHASGVNPGWARGRSEF